MNKTKDLGNYFSNILSEKASHRMGVDICNIQPTVGSSRIYKGLLIDQLKKRWAIQLKNEQGI